MPLGRTPPPSEMNQQTDPSVGAERRTLGDPSGRLGSVTRKWNEIEPLLLNPTEENRRTITRAYQELIERVCAFQDSCEGRQLQTQEYSLESDAKFAEWHKEKKKVTSFYLQEVSDWLKKHPLHVSNLVDVSDSISNHGSSSSKSSKRSQHSTTSSVRFRLLNERARLRAEEAVSQEEAAMQAQFEREKQRLESKKRQKLLQELDDVISETQSVVPSVPRQNGRSAEEVKSNFDLPVEVVVEGSPSFQHPASYVGASSEALQQKAFEMMVQAQARLTLPKNEPLDFDGSDCTKFFKFIFDFDEHIANKCTNDQERYSYLQKYTSGRPLALVMSCQYKNSAAERYQSARQRLYDQYGDKYKIAQQYFKSIEVHPPVKHEDGPALEEFATLLLNCKGVMEGVGPLKQLNSPKEIIMILMKLPYKMRENWRRKVFTWRRKNYEATFSDLADYVYEETLISNTPMYEQLKDSTPTKGKQHFPTASSKKKTFSTKISSQDKKTPPSSPQCECCHKSNHTLEKCFDLAKRTIEDRLTFLREHSLCFGCLKPGHSRKLCKHKLKCSKCPGSHPTCLHEDNGSKKGQLVPVQEDHEVVNNSGDEDTPKATCATSRGTNNSSTRVLCTAVPVRVRVGHSGRFVSTYLALDGWSTDSFMDTSLLKKIGAKCFDKNLSLSTMGSTNTLIPVKVVRNLEVQSLSGDYVAEIPEVYAKDGWPFALDDSPRPQDIDSFPHLKDLPFEFIKEKIGILVGMNMSDLLEPQRTVSGKSGQPYATQHRLGWALNGPVGIIISRRSLCQRTLINSEEILSTEEKLEELYTIEFRDQEAGIIGPSIEDLEWESKVKNSIKKTPDGHYEIGLPFRNNHPVLPPNFNQVYSRIQSKKKNLEKNPEIYKEYQDFMASMLEAGFAEVVPKNQLEMHSGKVWFLTHFAVRHKQKGKIRIVFDCSLKCRGTSLNDILYQGPDLTSGVLSVLLKFRQNKIAFMADIRKMFYQVRVSEKDSNFLRFLWYPDGDLSHEPMQYRLRVHVFGAVSSPSCANYALRRITEDNQEASEEAKSTIRKNFYVDDLVKATSDDHQATALIAEVCDLLETGGFELTGFVSSSRQVLSAIPKDRLSKELDSVNLTSEEDLPYERALGVTWKVQEDSLGFRVKGGCGALTKRGILSAIFSIYDHFGFAIPVILLGRSIFQEACWMKLQWDETLLQPLSVKWNDWWSEIPLLNDYSINRCYKGLPQDADNIQLHLFADGSERGYAAVAYIRFEMENSVRHCSLVMARARLVPAGNSALKTIPRIELNAAKLAVELMQILKRDLELKFMRIVLWSDSSTVLKYISCETGRFQRFVANRVAFIRGLTVPDQWHYVPGVQNPADLASRGCTASAFVKDELWKHGPSFLWESEGEWPLNTVQDVPSDCLEYKKGDKVESFPLSLATLPVERNIGMDKVWTLLTASSSWMKTKINVAWWMRTRKALQTKQWVKKPLSYKELKDSEAAILKLVQQKAFGLQLLLLKEAGQLRKNEPIIKLNPFIDACGLLRVGGRQSESSAVYDTRHPIILPKDSHIVTLIVREYHQDVGHLGRETVLSHLRTRFWIIKGSSLVRRILRDCLICRRIHAKPGDQIMADLPEERLAVGHPAFHNTGVDCFGPLIVKRGRGTDKRYGVIFTCLASRALHLELVSSLSSDSFICALRRFISRRGCPKIIRSDNGTNFVGACRELKVAFTSFQEAQLEPWCRQKGIEWKFNAPLASHQGGVWEREIASIKKILEALLRQQPLRLTDEALRTLLCEVENIMNSRPLTAVSGDSLDLEPLTPNHLLLLSSGATFPPGLFSRDDLYVQLRWRQVQYLADLFWTQFRREYLSLLQSRQKWVKEKRSLQVGELVLLTDQCLPRNLWSMGRIVEAEGDKKGRVRVVRVKVGRHKSGKNLKFSSTVLERPITKVILLKPVENLIT